MSKNQAAPDYVMSVFAGRGVKWFLIIFSLVSVLFPLYWLGISAFKLEQDYLANPPILVPTRFTIASFIEVFTQNQLLANLFNSMVVSTLTTLVTIIVGSMAAFALQRGALGRKTRHFFGVWFMVQKMYPAIATAIPVYLVMRELKLIDTLTGLIIMNISFNLPLVIWLMMGFFEQVPYEIEESAILDGANFFQRFFKVVLPIVKPGLIASAILTFTATWNEFLFAVILTIKDSKTLPVVIAGFITDRGLDWGPMAATSLVTLIPVVVLTLIVQKDFVQGMAMGAVKG